MFVLITSGIGVVFGGFTVITFEPVPGPDFSGTAVIFAIGMLIVCGAAFVACLFFKPRREYRSRSAILWSIAIYAGMVLSLIVASHSGRYDLRIRIVGPSHNPVDGAECKCFSYVNGTGLWSFDRTLNFRTNTSSNGEIQLRVNGHHTVLINVLKPGLEYASITLYSSGETFPHQLTLSDAEAENLPSDSKRDAAYPSENRPKVWLIPPQDTIQFTIVLEPEHPQEKRSGK